MSRPVDTLRSLFSKRPHRETPQRNIVRWALLLAAIGVIALVVHEIRYSRLQSYVFSRLAKRLTFDVGVGPGVVPRFPGGPYDERLGYARLQDFSQRLLQSGWKIERQARLSPEHDDAIARGLYPIYRERSVAGLRLHSHDGGILYEATYPKVYYPTYRDVPRRVIDVLLFVENRRLLDDSRPHANPAVDWGRLARLAPQFLLRRFGDATDRRQAGGSTLATQMEKFRHSPGGRTKDSRDKARQIISAATRAYMDGEMTATRRREILLDYVNSVPMGAAIGHGEVTGIGEAMSVYFGRDMARTTAALALENPSEEAAPVLREIVSLICAQRRPAHYLSSDGWPELGRLVDVVVMQMAREGIIPADVALRTVEIGRDFPQPKARVTEGKGGARSFVERKAANAVRVTLGKLLDVPKLYELDRLDLSVQSTIDAGLQDRVTRVLKSLATHEGADKRGLLGDRLLSRAVDPKDIIYSFALYENTPDGIVVRAQTDSHEAPFDLNEGGRIELGSTAKLRTLVTYLEAVSEIHADLSRLSMEQLKARLADVRADNATAAGGVEDKLAEWVASGLLGGDITDLDSALDLSLDRRFSSNPSMRFFTGGGYHTFSNFDRRDDGRYPTVREAFRESINLPFVRILREVVMHEVRSNNPDLPGIFQDPSNERRKELLIKQLSFEAEERMGRLLKDENATSETLRVKLVAAAGSPRRSAAVDVALQVPTERAVALYSKSKDEAWVKAYRAQRERLDKTQLTIAEYAYLASSPAIDLWVARDLAQNPHRTKAERISLARDAAIESESWLLSAKAPRRAQDLRIRTILEREAFVSIHAGWSQLGYPFPTLTPSYATALGSSGDRPAALAQLMGVIVSGGHVADATKLTSLTLGSGTPYETEFRTSSKGSRRVLGHAIARRVRGLMGTVVEDGTAVRLRGVFKDADGTPLKVGGKTGTGDNRFQTYGPDGRLVESRKRNRTATFVFYLGDRHFGTLTAMALSREAAEKSAFTSSLPVQVLKAMAPEISPHINPDK